jgi:hypothetical protein
MSDIDCDGLALLSDDVVTLVQSDHLVSLLLRLACCSVTGKERNVWTEDMVRLCDQDILIKLKVYTPEWLIKHRKRALDYVPDRILVKNVYPLLTLAIISGNLSATKRLHYLSPARSGKPLYDVPTRYTTLGNLAIRNGQIEVADWFFGLGMFDRSSLCVDAALSINLDAMKWVRSKRVAWCSEAMNVAASFNNAEMIKWMRGYDSQNQPISNYGAVCPWGDYTCAEIAGHGNLELLKWLRDPRIHGSLRAVCRWDDSTCAQAAYGGHIHVLEWLRTPQDYGIVTKSKSSARKQPPPLICPWYEWTCTSAVTGNQLETLKWLRNSEIHNGSPCPWDDNTYRTAVVENNKEILEWMAENGFPAFR